ncbi:MAG TPA: ankyrin repeat domain-containing protein [Tepidisphaeraceae bacterium]|jgi:hypothetical protein|nr:ankyrin repeat domain-containing protein [Tepidisphaeraceae bacterium]
MSLAKLKKLVRPPSEPVFTGAPKLWGQIEKKLGTKLPDDYKKFIDAYGSGDFAQFYAIYNPLQSHGVVEQIDEVRQDYRQGHESNSERYPYPVFPEPSGIFPWGNDENGNDYFWLTKGDPDEWTVVAYDVRGGGAKEHKCTMTEFLLKVLTKEIPALAGGYPKPEHLEFSPLAKENMATQALLDGIREHDMAGVRAAMKAKPDLNYRFGEGTTPLHFAANNGLLEAVKLLIDAGADVNGKTDDGSPPLFNCDPSVVDYLLSRGADINLKRKDGDTAIFAALWNGAYELAEKLAGIPGVLKQKNKVGQTPLAFAKSRKDAQAIEALKRPRPRND